MGAGEAAVFYLGQVEKVGTVEDAARFGVDLLVGAQDGDVEAGGSGSFDPEAVDGDAAVDGCGGVAGEGQEFPVLGRGARGGC